jgi:DNA topoisomerase-1
LIRGVNVPPRKKPVSEPTPKKKPATNPAAKTKTPPAVKKAAAKEVARAVPARIKKAPTSVATEKAPTARTTGRSLVIVESPAKAKTIEKYLGPGFKVLASYGHVRDLPPKGKLRGEDVVGVDIKGGWIPRYVVVDRGAKSGNRKVRTAEDILAELKKEADKSSIIYLATDPDREGESIAWHISEALGLDPKITRRIAFNEITKTAVQRAIASPTSINDQLVQAQEARRVLDRIVGYPLSNLLGKKVTRGLSAGRVQSVAVKLIVDREREIEAFKSEEYWKIIALLAPQGKVQYTADPAKAKIYARKRGENLGAKPQAAEAEADPDAPEKEVAPKIPPGSFQAELVRWQGKEFAATNETEADTVYAALNTAAYVVTKVDQKDEQRRAPAPFTTSTLQQAANQRLRFPARMTMNLAQELYQGVNLGSEGSVALITYMRTDSTRVSDDALKMVREHIKTSFGDRYLPDKPNTFKSGKSAQEAHEAIRPTDLTYSPTKVQPYLSPDQFRMYQLIYNQFVASQMTPAIVAVTSVDIEAGAGQFRASGSVEKFDGYRKVLSPAKQDDKVLPPLSEKQPLDKLDLTASQHFTQPPPRYNEASLVKTLEKEGIGRPSTYATIISTIQQRGYVKQEHRRFYATEIGKVVTDLLVKSFPDVINLKFTSHIEEELDDIENGKIKYREVLDEFWAPFSKDLAEAETGMEKQKGVETGEKCPKCGRPLVEMYSKKTGRKFVGCSGWKEKENPCSYIKPGEGEAERPDPVLTEHKCPTCGKQMVQKVGRFGTYLACSGAPDCKTTMNIGADGKPVIASKATEHICEKCGKPMMLKEWKGRYFLGCSGYPKCRNSMDADANGNPIKPVDTGVKCDKCQSPMVVKRGFRGPFLSCSGYPKCRNAKPIPAELKEKLKDALPPAPERKKTPDILVDVPCPQCGAKMRLCNARGRYFLGCSTWAKTKCKGSMPIEPEAVEALQKKAAENANA